MRVRQNITGHGMDRQTDRQTLKSHCLFCFSITAPNGLDPQIEDQIRERLCFRFTNDLFSVKKIHWGQHSSKWVTVVILILG